MNKFTSRKFLVMAAQGLILVALPILYKHFEIADSILMTVLISTSALAAAYTGVNVIDQKINGKGDASGSAQ